VLLTLQIKCSSVQQGLALDSVVAGHTVVVPLLIKMLLLRLACGESESERGSQS
jgi:hypothetical protein